MFLENILESKKKILEKEKAEVSIEELYQQINPEEKCRDIKSRFLQGEIGIIAEVKKASPSKGLIREDFHPLDIAKEYEKNNAAAISVLTEEEFFLGKKEYLKEIKKNTSIPVLRKDFIIDPYQIVESKVLNADIILLIAAILKEEEIIEFSTLAHKVGLQTLVEIHEEEEIEKALKAEADIIGINNRNLKTFETSIKNTERIKKLLPKDRLIISESGIYTREDMKYLEEIGVRGVLIGESLMRADSITEKMKELRDMKTKIKICGLQSAEDIEMVNELMPEYAGFVFCESRRKVSKEKAEELIKSLDSKIKKVGVFLDQDLEEVHNIAQDCSLDILQFHGSESQQYCNSFIQEIWKSFLVEDESSLEMLENYSTEGYLLDSFVKRVAGGSGKKFNWEILENKEIPRTFILAGGLNSENVQEGIRRTKPDIVDVSSGVETNGCKDYQKIKEFIRKVRA